MFRCVLAVAVVVLALGSSATAMPSAAAKTSNADMTHKLIVAVKRSRPTAKKLAVLVLITQNGGAPAAAVATPAKPLTVLLDNPGLYHVKAEIDSSCRGSCAASYRIRGSANHELEVVPSCQSKASGFVCSKVSIVRVY